MVPFSVDLCIHALGDDIRKVVVSGAISEFNNVFASVEQWIGVGTPYGLAGDSLCTFDNAALPFVAGTNIKDEFSIQIFVHEIIIDIVRFRRFREDHIPIVGFACHPRCVIRFVLNIKIMLLVQCKVC